MKSHFLKIGLKIREISRKQSILSKNSQKQKNLRNSKIHQISSRSVKWSIRAIQTRVARFKVAVSIRNMKINQISSWKLFSSASRSEKLDFLKILTVAQKMLRVDERYAERVSYANKHSRATLDLWTIDFQCSWPLCPPPLPLCKHSTLISS